MAGTQNTSYGPVGGNTPDNSVDVGDPVKVGARYNATAPTYADGDRTDAQATARGLLRVEGQSGSPTLSAEETADDSDKALTVPAGKVWIFQSLRVEFTATATVGNRQVAVQVRDDTADVVFEVVAGAVQAASEARNYHFAPQVADLTAFRDTDFLSTPMPALVLPAGYDIRIFDNNAVDAAADDMIVQALVIQRDAP